MDLNVWRACESWQNRLNKPVVFEGRRVRLSYDRSVCHQLFELWRRGKGSITYESFLKLLRFTDKGGEVWASVARDYTPWIAGGLAVGGALGVGTLVKKYWDSYPTDWDDVTPLQFQSFMDYMREKRASNFPSDLFTSEEYAHILRDQIRDNFRKDLDIMAYIEYQRKFPSGNIEDYKKYLTSLANGELSNSLPDADPSQWIQQSKNPVDQNTLVEQQSQTFGSTGVSNGKQKLMCVSVVHLNRGECIYVDATDKWADFQRKLESSTGVRVENQKILVMNKGFINTIDGLKGWRDANHGGTWVFDASTNEALWGSKK
jgi:hypothetical protein